MTTTTRIAAVFAALALTACGGSNPATNEATANGWTHTTVIYPKGNPPSAICNYYNKAGAWVAWCFQFVDGSGTCQPYGNDCYQSNLPCTNDSPMPAGCTAQ